MSDPEEPAAGPGIEAFLGEEATSDLEHWRWLWRGDHPFPIRSHRRLWGRLVVGLKRLLRPLVKGPQADLWDRQRAFNLIVISHLVELRKLYRLEAALDRLGQDLQQVQEEILRDLRRGQQEYLRDREALTERLERLEEFLRDGLDEVRRHHDALFSRVDQKMDRLRRLVPEAAPRPDAD